MLKRLHAALRAALRSWGPAPPARPRLSTSLWIGPDSRLWGRLGPQVPWAIERPVAGFDRRGGLLLMQARPCE